MQSMAIKSGAATPSASAARSRSLTRRAVIGAALAGGAGVAAIRLLGAERIQQLVPSRPGARSDWVSPLGSESARVRQLLRRATFGATPEELDRALSDGYSRTVDRLLETPAAPPPLPGADSVDRTTPLRIPLLQRWWLDWMLSTPTPFAERMTLFWHGHFTSDFRKVGVQTPWIYWQNLTWRSNALGNFRDFLYAVTIDPGMLRYLDLGTSTGNNPNENYSRELMELFTMGPGNYSEEDVRQAARALAGWTFPRPGVDSSKTGIFDPRRAYKGQVTFLGKTGQLDTQGVLDRILAQRATAPFVVNRLLVHFVMPNPPQSYVNRLADGFVRSKWSIKQLMHDVLTSPEFTSAGSYRSLVKDPTELMVSALKAVGAPGRTDLAVQSASGLGQVLFDPPDVGGWPLNDAWISSNTVIQRVNFATTLLGTLKPAPPASDAHKKYLDGVLSPATASALNAAKDDATRWLVVLASPEFQLK